MTLRMFASALLAAAALHGQEGLNPAKLMQPPVDTWPMYHGDYSGRRFSTLTKINSSNVNSLTLAWISVIVLALAVWIRRPSFVFR